MIVLYVTLIVVSFLVLGAHFLRFGAMPLVALCLFLPFLLFVRRPWVARVIQVALVLGGLEWLRTVISLIGNRQASGEPWTRMALILGVVALVAFVSALTFQLRPLKKWYFPSDKLEREAGPESERD